MAHKPKKIKKPLLVKLITGYIRFTSIFIPILAKKLAYKLFFRAFRYPFKDDERRLKSEATLFDIIYKSQKIQGYKWGEGNKIALCMHGWSGRAVQFWKMIAPLNRAGYQVIAFDAPGHGKSEGQYTSLVDFKTIIFKLSKEYNFDIVIAHSLGGAASLLAVKEGLNPNKLVLISPPVIPDLLLKEFRSRIGANKKVTNYIKDQIEKDFGFKFEEFFPESYLPLENIPPILIIHDTSDRDVPFTNGQRLKELIPKAQFMVTEDLGHTRIMRDDEVIQKIVDFTAQ